MNARFFVGSVVAASLFAPSFFAGPTHAEHEATTCSAAIIPAKTKHAYRNIGDGLCEGEFQREVGSSLDLISLTDGALPRPQGSSVSLRLEWLATDVRGVQVTARVLELDTYYRMDASPRDGAAAYRWPLAAMAAAGYSSKRIAVRAMADVAPLPSKQKRRLLIPVRAQYEGLSTNGSLTPFYYLALISGDEIDWVRASLWDETAAGREQVKDAIPVAEGPFKPTYPITVKVPHSTRGPGIYTVELVARARTGDSAPLRVEFAHE